MTDIQLVFVPDARLKKASEAVDASEFGEELEKHMNNMLNKMYELNGVGLAGVQAGDMRRLLVADPGTGAIMLVNPEVVEKSEETVSYEEGCLSLPGFQLKVERNENIKVKYKTPLGEEVEKEFFGIEAVVVQHEMDHLDGITLLNKVSKLKRDIYLRKIKKFKRRIKRRIKQRTQAYY